MRKIGCVACIAGKEGKVVKGCASVYPYCMPSLYAGFSGIIGASAGLFIIHSLMMQQIMNKPASLTYSTNGDHSGNGLSFYHSGAI
jgi:hypothetical protein